jgi:CelD/BcsL family acetyltransferase involved in cellulose biosynthesis
VLLNEKPVSVMYVFAYKKNAFFYQNGWEPGLARYGIGIYNIQESLRHAAASGFLTFDFLRGEEDYKYKLCNEIRQAYTIMLFGAGVAGRLSRILFRVKAWLRDMIRGKTHARGAVERADSHYTVRLEGAGH